MLATLWRQSAAPRDQVLVRASQGLEWHHAYRENIHGGQPGRHANEIAGWTALLPATGHVAFAASSGAAATVEGSMVMIAEASDEKEALLHVSSRGLKLNIDDDFVEMIAIKLLLLHGAAMLTLGWLCHALWKSWLNNVA